MKQIGQPLGAKKKPTVWEAETAVQPAEVRGSFPKVLQQTLREVREDLCLE